ncbi:DUF1396 domain-containing protein [Streptomyces botrytidirepellens]|nr:DUF1396 domain-containing protein [Streptomyces botrytidirepellens]
MGIVARTGPDNRRGRAGVAVLAAALLCAGAAGCGSPESGGGERAHRAAKEPRMAPAAAVRAAAKKTEKLTSLRYRMTGQTLDEGRVEGEGAMAFNPPVARMKMRTRGEDEAGTVEYRLTGGVMYLGGGAVTAGLGSGDSDLPELDGKRWLALDASELEKRGSGSQGSGSLTGRAKTNPADESAFLSDADNLRRVGGETIDGVRTTHYRGTVTLEQMRASLEDEKSTTRERRDKALTTYEEAGIDRLNMDMWIDPDSHTKRFRMRGDADKGRLDVTMTFLDINKPITVQAPPASETLNLSDLARSTRS